jgi:hypothetical protein
MAARKHVLPVALVLVELASLVIARHHHTALLAVSTPRQAKGESSGLTDRQVKHGEY